MQVAVKVQYLGLESAVTADLSTLSVLGAVAALAFPGSFDFGYSSHTLQMPWTAGAAANLFKGQEKCCSALHASPSPHSCSMTRPSQIWLSRHTYEAKCAGLAMVVDLLDDRHLLAALAHVKLCVPGGWSSG